MESMILTAFALLGALFLSPLLQFLLLFGIFALGHLHPFLISFFYPSSIKIYSFLGKLFFLLVPNLDLFYIATEISEKKIYPFSYVLVAFLYEISYTFFILLFTFLRFEKKEF